MSGEANRVKIMRDLGVSINTVYNVTGELTKLGYVLAIQQKPKKAITPTTSTPIHQTHQKGNLSEESSESEVVNLTGRTGQLTSGLKNEELSESRRRKISPVG
jgi:sugar-specific transcriptional regulator TrmB